MAIVWGVAIVVLAGLVIIVGRAIRLWWTWRGARVIGCPENHRPAGVFVDAAHVAANPFGKSPDLRLSSCSRWPERAACGQECLKQIEAAPEDCLVRTILAEWYAGKHCASCGHPFGNISASGAKPAILCADKNSVEWNQIPAERLPETLAAGSPICFACHMGSLLIRTHPELAVDRHRAADADRN
ncbi:MAG TPA: hypothetical protein VMB03_13175 [Bryobacteraceae bacterium]|nr:hypothetical protein [Bryobacteraceae bacterium]